MSYILEALKRSEQARRDRGELPSVPHLEPRPRQGRQELLLVLLLSVLVNLGLLAWLVWG